MVWNSPAVKLKPYSGSITIRRILISSIHSPLLPQSIYPTDMRESRLLIWAAISTAIFSLAKALANCPIPHLLVFREDSQYGGYPYLLRPVGISYHSYGGIQYGGDLRWKTPLEGLTVGMSRMNERIEGDGRGPWRAMVPLPPTRIHRRLDEPILWPIHKGKFSSMPNIVVITAISDSERHVHHYNRCSRLVCRRDPIKSWIGSASAPISPDTHCSVRMRARG